MDKTTFIELLKGFRKELADLLSACRGVAGGQVQARATLDRLEETCTRWFDQVEPTLRSTYQIPQETLRPYRDRFGKLLELSAGRPSKQVVLTILETTLRDFHPELIVPVQQYSEMLLKYPDLDLVLSHTSGLETEYLQEAIDCARLGKRRAAIILAWCAAIDRLHHFVIASGLDAFNAASVQMAAMTTGRYKRFSKHYSIQNLPDLRMSVFDGDLLWVLEFLGAIDGNQHERLEICFTMRNTSAHPGDTTVSPENVLSFFSDIDTMVLDNPKFTRA